MLTNGSLQGVTILKDKILEDNTGVASHPDKIASYKVAALQSSNLVWRKTTACCREMQGFGSHCFDF